MEQLHGFLVFLTPLLHNSPVTTAWGKEWCCYTTSSYLFLKFIPQKVLHFPLGSPQGKPFPSPPAGHGQEMSGRHQTISVFLIVPVAHQAMLCWVQEKFKLHQHHHFCLTAGKLQKKNPHIPFPPPPETEQCTSGMFCIFCEVVPFLWGLLRGSPSTCCFSWCSSAAWGSTLTMGLFLIFLALSA